MLSFVDDYTNALQRAVSLDSRILADADAISDNYGDLVSLAARQAMSGMELTVGQGDPDADVMMFMQDSGASTYVFYLNTSL